MIRAYFIQLALYCLLLVNIGYLEDPFIYILYASACQKITSEQRYKPSAFISLPRVEHMGQSLGNL